MKAQFFVGAALLQKALLHTQLRVSMRLVTEKQTLTRL